MEFARITYTPSVTLGRPEALVFVGLVLLLDCVSLVLSVRRIRKGRGSSGIPGLPLVLYSIIAVFGDLPVQIPDCPMLLMRLGNFMLLAAMHVMLQYIAPLAYRAWHVRSRG
jgi:hypothetical protein